jgi:hypothetical protein
MTRLQFDNPFDQAQYEGEYNDYLASIDCAGEHAIETMAHQLDYHEGIVVILAGETS